MRKPKRSLSIPPLTAEEIHFACAAAGAAYDGRMLTKPVSETFSPVAVAGTIVTLTDIPLNRAAGAVLDALKHDPEKARAALFRIMVIGFGVFNHPDVEKWQRRLPDGSVEVAMPLLLALGTVPAKWSRKTKAEEVFRLARKIASKGPPA